MIWALPLGERPKAQAHDAVQHPVGYDGADPHQDRGVAPDGVAGPGTGRGRGPGDHPRGVFGRNAILAERSGLCRKGRRRYGALLLTSAHGITGFDLSGHLDLDKWHTNAEELVDTLISLLPKA